ncbi:MAG: hypothetical protein KatS3mg068_0146 [Candidatus Sericytochromatia bacterium]|nr:MAG: hypothetical protein KatS3mg068_0146 [Candidatus Sericytochromatia bacterium]
MAYNSTSMNSMINYFNNLIAQQMMAQNFYNNMKVGQTNQNQQSSNSTEQTSEQSEQLSTALSNALSSLATLLAGSNNSSNTSALSSSMTYMIGDLISKGVDAQKLTDAINSMMAPSDDDILYTRTGSNDPWITLQNRTKVSGADIQSVLYQAGTLASKGKDVNAYLDMVKEVCDKCDYDDIRRLVSVTNTMLYANQDLNKFYEFGREIINKRHYDFESNIFSVQTLVGNGGVSLDTALKIMRNMENIGLNGRNNMVDLSRVTVDARRKGAFMPYFLQQMADSGDTRAFMDAYMKSNGMETTAPDFNRFKRIERIDGEDMVITEGESAALFAQAISSTQGLLDKSVLYWSSVQTGAMFHGDNYLDLSKLKAGVYDIYVKIGNYGGGTDTAKKRVIVKPKDEEVLVDGGGKNEKPKENNGLGDKKDCDNPVKFEDASNPGKGSVNAGNKTDETPKVDNNQKVNENKNVTTVQENKQDNKVNNNEVKETKTTIVETQTTKEVSDDYPEMSDIDKMRRLYALSLGRITASEAYDYIDEKVGKGNVVKFLNEIGQTSMAQKYENRTLGWMDFMLAMAKDPQFYQKASAEFRRNVSEEEAAKFFKNNDFNDKDTKEALWLLGYRKNSSTTKVEVTKNVEVKIEEKVKSNNGLGDKKDCDNLVKFEDASNPGKGSVNAGSKVDNNNNKSEEVKSKPVTETTLQQSGKIRVEVKKGDAALSSDLYMVHNGQTILVAKDANKTGVNTVLERDFKEGDKVSFFIRTNATSWGLGVYDHGNEDVSSTGKPYATKTINSSTSWTLGFEDLPEKRADWDYNDVVVNVTLLPNQNTSESTKKVEKKKEDKKEYNLNTNLLVDNRPKNDNKKVENNVKKQQLERKDNENSNKDDKEVSLSEKYKKQNEEYKLLLETMTKNSENYRKQIEEERARLRKKDVEKSLNNKLLEQRLENETKKLKSNNGLGDMKDTDNIVKFQDSSNPGKAEKR